MRCSGARHTSVRRRGLGAFPVGVTPSLNPLQVVCRDGGVFFSFSIKINDRRVSFPVNWRGGRGRGPILNLMFDTNSLTICPPPLPSIHQNQQPSKFPCCAGCRSYGSARLHVCQRAGSRPMGICQSFRDPSASVGQDNEVDTDSPAVPACLAV